jgi:hypothetical protein
MGSYEAVGLELRISGPLNEMNHLKIMHGLGVLGLRGG